MIHPNIFKPRNDWNVITLRCRKNYVLNPFEQKLCSIIKSATGISPLADMEYRGRYFVQSRQLFLALMVKHTNTTLEKIGSYVGKDHATVLHAVKAINNSYDTDKRFRTLYDEIDNKVKNLK